MSKHFCLESHLLYILLDQGLQYRVVWSRLTQSRDEYYIRMYVYVMVPYVSLSKTFYNFQYNIARLTVHVTFVQKSFK